MISSIYKLPSHIQLVYSSLTIMDGAPVAHSCNPSYSRGRDQEDRYSKPVQANSSARPYLEKPFSKTGLMEWLKVKALITTHTKKIMLEMLIKASLCKRSGNATLKYVVLIC
jgi:hypothetical protein